MPVNPTKFVSPDRKFSVPMTLSELAIVRDSHRKLADQLALGGFHLAATKLRTRADGIQAAIAECGDAV